MCTILADIFAENEINRIGVTGEDHVTGTKSDSIIGVCSNAV